MEGLDVTLEKHINRDEEEPHSHIQVQHFIVEDIVEIPATKESLAKEGKGQLWFYFLMIAGRVLREGSQQEEGF